MFIYNWNYVLKHPFRKYAARNPNPNTPTSNGTPFSTADADAAWSAKCRRQTHHHLFGVPTQTHTHTHRTPHRTHILCVKIRTLANAHDMLLAYGGTHNVVVVDAHTHTHTCA